MSTLFVSHGAPNLILHNTAAKLFLQSYGQQIEKPRAILMVTAHFEAHRPTLTNGAHPGMIYDFGGFEPELRTVQYPAPGAPDVAQEAFALLDKAGFSPALADRGYDHGTWVPLALLRPDACTEWRKKSSDRRTSPAALRCDGRSRDRGQRHTHPFQRGIWRVDDGLLSVFVIIRTVRRIARRAPSQNTDFRKRAIRWGPLPSEIASGKRGL